MHQVCSPNILYFGTPVVLISTVNEEGGFNLAPMSSAFWLGWRCVIGLAAASKTTENILRNKECVLNLPSVAEADKVDCLALTTGSNPVPEGKRQKGYRHEANKFELGGFHSLPSLEVRSPRVKECPVHLEAVLIQSHGIAEDNPLQKGKIITMELKIVKVHIDQSILMDNHENKIDPDKWRPLIMSFQQFYGLGERVRKSTLSTVPEEMYRTTDLKDTLVSLS